MALLSDLLFQAKIFYPLSSLCNCPFCVLFVRMLLKNHKIVKPISLKIFVIIYSVTTNQLPSQLSFFADPLK